MRRNKRKKKKMKKKRKKTQERKKKKRKRKKRQRKGKEKVWGGPETKYHPARSRLKECTLWGPQPVVDRVENAIWSGCLLTTCPNDCAHCIAYIRWPLNEVPPCTEPPGERVEICLVPKPDADKPGC